MRKPQRLRIFLLALAMLVVGSTTLPTTAEAIVSNSGLTGYWSFNEGAGTAARDFSGNSNNGTLVGPPTWTTSGRFGNALTFNGGEYVDVSSMSSISGGSALTISAWVYRTGGDQYDGIVSKINGVSSIDLLLSGGLAGLDDIFVRVDSGISNYGYTTSNLITVNTWHHVVMVFDGTQSGNSNRMKVYIDGVQQTLTFNGTIGATVPSVSRNMYVGYYTYGGDDDFFTGRIDDVRVYTRALSGAEVSDLYAAHTGLPKPANNLGLIGYWPLNEGAGTQAGDFSGNRNSGTLIDNGSGYPAWVTGKVGTALNFSTLDNYVSVQDSSLFDFATAGSFTWSGWVKPAALATFANVFGFGAGGAMKLTIYAGYDGNSSYFSGGSLTKGAGVVWQDNGATYIASEAENSIPVANRWYHVTVTYDGTQAAANRFKIYVNGVNVTGTAAVNGTISALAPDSIQIGADGVGGAYFNGTVDDMRLYNRLLSAAEVASLYGNGSSIAGRANASSAGLTKGTSLATGLISLWTFDGGDTIWTSATAGTATDRSGSGNTGTLTNMNISSATANGKLGQALSFDGVDDTVATAGGAAINSFLPGATKTSVSFWIFDPTIEDSQVIFSNANGLTSGIRLITGGSGAGSNNNDIMFFPDASTGHNSAWTTSHGHQAGVWEHWVLIYDGTQPTDSTKVRIYLNGVAQTVTGEGNVNTSLTSSGQPLTLGFDPVDGGFTRLSARLDDVRFYNRLLSVAEILQLSRLGQAVVR